MDGNEDTIVVASDVVETVITDEGTNMDVPIMLKISNNNNLIKKSYLK